MQSKKSYINMDDKIIKYIEYNYYIYRTDHTFNIISGHPGRTSMSTTQSKANWLPPDEGPFQALAMVVLYLYVCLCPFCTSVNIRQIYFYMSWPRRELNWTKPPFGDLYENNVLCSYLDNDVCVEYPYKYLWMNSKNIFINMYILLPGQVDLQSWSWCSLWQSAFLKKH